MPQITIDLSDEAYAFLVEQGEIHQQTPEEALKYYAERTLPVRVAEHDAQQRLSMVQAIITTVVQEILKPLAVIEESVTTLRREAVNRPELYEALEKEYTRLTRLIDDLFNVCRAEVSASLMPDFGLMALRETVKKAILIDHGSTYKKENHTLVYHIEDNVLDNITADADKLEQVLHNIVGNALKFSPDGGEVRLTVGMQDPETLLFTVSDQGLGMSPEFLERFGEKFARAEAPEHPSLNGTGIGVFLAKHFVQLHGGTLWAESAGLGQGTTVSFTIRLVALPVSHDPEYLRLVESIRTHCQSLLQRVEGIGWQLRPFDAPLRTELSAILTEALENLHTCRPDARG